MVFSGIPFLFYFLPCVLILYFIAPKGWKNFVLLLSSLIFYAWGEPKFVLVMLFSILQGYVFGILIEKSGDRRAKAFLAVSVGVSLGILCYCKYANFFVENFNKITGLSVPLLKITLPIGISFYTFQIVSYVVDVYRKEVPAQRNFINLAAYIAMFPQLIAGPIVRYSTIAEQLVSREHSLDKISDGARRFIIGLGKKVLIANTLGELCSLFRQTDEKSLLFFWLYAVACTLQIYFDFSGYSDMAIGLGKIFGFEFMENFNYPFISASATEFWRRWHISLGSWFRDYVYIPLGGNRVTKTRWLINLLIVWFLTGFWHGADWNFIIWGLFFGVLLIGEKLLYGEKLAKLRILSHVYVLLAVIISFVFFEAADVAEAWTTVKALFGAGNFPLVNIESLYYLRSYCVVFLVAILGSTPLAKRIVIKIKTNSIGEKLINLAEPVFLVGLLAVITAYIVDGSFNPFLYFRF